MLWREIFLKFEALYICAIIFSLLLPAKLNNDNDYNNVFEHKYC